MSTKITYDWFESTNLRQKDNSFGITFNVYNYKTTLKFIYSKFNDGEFTAHLIQNGNEILLGVVFTTEDVKSLLKGIAGSNISVNPKKKTSIKYKSSCYSYILRYLLSNRTLHDEYNSILTSMLIDKISDDFRQKCNVDYVDYDGLLKYTLNNWSDYSPEKLVDIKSNNSSVDDNIDSNIDNIICNLMSEMIKTVPKETKTGGNIIIQNLKVGDIIHDYDFNINISSKVISKPVWDGWYWTWTNKIIDHPTKSRLNKIITYHQAHDKSGYRLKLYTKEV